MKNILFDKNVAPVAWSAQRVGTLNSCPKKYRYRYLMKGGWHPDATEELKRIYRLGLLQNESSYAGILMHKHIRRMIAGEMNGFHRRLAESVETACREFALAVELGALQPLDGLRKGRVKFLSQEQGKSISPADVTKWQLQIRQCLETWDKMEEVKELIDDASSIIPHLLDPPAPILTECLGVPIYLKTDAVLSSGDHWIVYDWKTGRPNESDGKQAGIYEAFIRAEFELTHDITVVVRYVYLTEGIVKSFSFTAEEREELLWQIAEEHTDLLITDADHSERRFPARANGLCQYCPYQFNCPEGKKRVSAQAPAKVAGGLI
ncbi:MAG: PD-(D/E)XK nuclease family protein [Terrimicrobiaceae bacterium]